MLPLSVVCCVECHHIHSKHEVLRLQDSIGAKRAGWINIIYVSKPSPRNSMHYIKSIDQTMRWPKIRMWMEITWQLSLQSTSETYHKYKGVPESNSAPLLYYYIHDIIYIQVQQEHTCTIVGFTGQTRPQRIHRLQPGLFSSCKNWTLNKGTMGGWKDLRERYTQRYHAQFWQLTSIYR